LYICTNLNGSDRAMRWCYACHHSFRHISKRETRKNRRNFFNETFKSQAFNKQTNQQEEKNI